MNKLKRESGCFAWDLGSVVRPDRSNPVERSQPKQALFTHETPPPL